MKSSAKKIELASVDDLFSTEEGRQDAKLEKIQEIPLSELHPFKNHPFKVKDDEAMMETADSIKQYGVLVPAIARPDPEGGYELVPRKWNTTTSWRSLPNISRKWSKLFRSVHRWYTAELLTRPRITCSRLPRMAVSWGLTRGSSTRCCRTNLAQRSISVWTTSCRSGGTAKLTS